MNTQEQAVRQAADTLRAAIADATAAGFVVAPQALVDVLDRVTISETAKVIQPTPVEPEAAPQPEPAPAPKPQAETPAAPNDGLLPNHVDQ